MWANEEYAELIWYFGSLDRSVLSLYQAMSGGDDWTVFYHALSHIGGWWDYLFLFYITFTIFALANVVIGIFVDTAVQSGRADKEVMLHEELETKRETLTALAQLFEALDKDQDGTISKAEFDLALDQDKVVAMFKALKLDIRAAVNLFDLLDRDRSGEVDVDEFIEGCYALQGEATACEAKMMYAEVNFMRKEILNICDMLEFRGRRRHEPSALPLMT